MAKEPGRCPECRAAKIARALLKLADKYGVNRLEAACEKALSYTPNPSYKSIQTILKTSQDKVVKKETVPNDTSAEFGFTRGADYYGRNS